MRNLICSILLTLAVSTSAQWYQSEAVQTLGVFTASIVLDAMGDACNDSGSKVLGHTLQAASIGTLIGGIYLIDSENWGWKTAAYISLRIAIFDPIYNATRGLPLGYVGDSSMWDKALRATRSPESWILAARVPFLIVGITIPINEL